MLFEIGILYILFVGIVFECNVDYAIFAIF